MSEDKKLTPNDVIVHLIHSINLDFYKHAESYLDTLSRTGDSFSRVAVALRGKPQIMRLNALTSDVSKLITQTEVVDELVYMDKGVLEIVDVLINEWKNSGTLKAHNIPIRNKILLHGPTGNGKTTIARHISKLAGLPFVEVNSDQVVDSRIGSTGHNINNIFNKINEPCVLFWDEIDTIGKVRGSTSGSAAAFENDRMVNSVLVNIDKMSSDVIFIGATNRKKILDTAFLRRFDSCIEIKEPSKYDKVKYGRALIDIYGISEHPVPDDFITQFSSFSEIKNKITEHARYLVLKNTLPQNE